MTIRINYSGFRDHPLTCPDCGWEGSGEDACQNTGGMVMDLECPKCFKMLAIINFPNIKQTLSRGGEAERQAVLQEINFREKFKHMSLKHAGQLPDIEGDQISFNFKSLTIKGEDFNIIENQGQEIWREPMVWEGYERFIEIGRIIKERYGARMVDMIPDETAQTFLYGDKLNAPAIIAEFRKKLK